MFFCWKTDRSNHFATILKSWKIGFKLAFLTRLLYCVAQSVSATIPHFVSATFEKRKRATFPLIPSPTFLNYPPLFNDRMHKRWTIGGSWIVMSSLHINCLHVFVTSNRWPWRDRGRVIEGGWRWNFISKIVRSPRCLFWEELISRSLKILKPDFFWRRYF